MKHLAIAAIAATGLGGCIIVDDHDHHGGGGGGGGGGALLTAHWELKDVATQTTTACPAGFNTGNIITQMVDAKGTFIGPPQNDLFFCDDHIDTIELEPAIYMVSVAIENRDSDANLLATYTESLADTVDLTNVDGTYQTQILNDGGRVAFGWNLVDSTQKPVDCSALGNGMLGSIATDVADATHVVDTDLACTDGFVPVSGPKALTGDLELVAGDWTMQIQATNDGTALSAPVMKSLTMGDKDDLQDLGQIQLVIAPQTTP